MVIGFQEFYFRNPPGLLIRLEIKYFINVFKEDVAISNPFPKCFPTIFTVPEIQNGGCGGLKPPLDGHIGPWSIGAIKIPCFVSPGHCRVDIYPTTLWTVAVTSEQVFLGCSPVPERIINCSHIVGDNVEVIAGTKDQYDGQCYKYFM